jgi:hypothetical protein
VSAQPEIPLRRHADHDPGLICRPALGYGLCELLEPDEGDGSEIAATEEAG